MVSPANPGKAHNYNDVKNAVVHEMVHAYNSVLNSDVELWMNEGLAVYLANQKPSENFYKHYCVPKLFQIHTDNNMQFAGFGGYQFAYTYIDYLVNQYGVNKVLQFAKTGDYENTFGKSEKEIYNEWKELFTAK